MVYIYLLLCLSEGAQRSKSLFFPLHRNDLYWFAKLGLVFIIAHQIHELRLL
jgi:hypothetical protein